MVAFVLFDVEAHTAAGLALVPILLGLLMPIRAEFEFVHFGFHTILFSF
jgi:hypothetical protein